MSKEPDKDAVEPTDGKRSRRRRRRSGLRVPSDDVPRRHPAVVAVPPVPPGSDLHDDAAEYPAAGPAPEDQLEGDSENDSADEENDAADEMDDLDPVDVAESPMPPMPPMIDGQDQEADPAAAEAIPVYQEDRPPVLARAITQEMLAVSVPAPHTDAVAAEEEPAPEQRPSFDDNLSKTVRMTALPFDVPGPLSQDGEDDDSVDIPIEEDEPAPTELPQRRPRAATMALSDDDLEELLESSESDDAEDDDAEDAMAALAAMLGTARPSFTRAAPVLDDEDDAAGEDSPRAEALAEPNAESLDDESAADDALSPVEEQAVSAAKEAPEQTPDADEVAAADAQPGRAVSEAPVDLADASDSGEILEDDMIEEMDEPTAASRQEPLAPPAPPPAPPKHAPAKPAPKTPPPAPKSSESTPAKGRTRKGKSWFEEIFDEDYLRTLPFLTPQATQAEALFVAEALDVGPGARLLDVGCGYGRHAMELAARGYQIVALDLSLALLLRGADEAQRRGLNINFIHGDMRDLAFENQFDGIYCLFSTFGYFDEETNRKTIEGMARAVKPGGRLVLDVLNRDYLIGELPTRVWWEGDGCVVLEEIDFNYFNSRIHSNRSIVFDDGRQIEQEISIRSYSLHELGKLLHTARGLRVLEVSGSTATRGRFFGNQSRGLIVVAEKRERVKTFTASGTEPLENTDSEDVPDVDVPDV